jgi:hypothetical protein
MKNNSSCSCKNRYEEKGECQIEDSWKETIKDIP